MYIATVQIVFKRLQSLEYEPNNMAPRMLSYFYQSLKLNWHNSTTAKSDAKNVPVTNIRKRTNSNVNFRTIYTSDNVTVAEKLKLKQTQNHGNVRPTDGATASPIVHFVGTRWTKTPVSAWNQSNAVVAWGHAPNRLRSRLRSCSDRYDIVTRVAF